MKEPLRRTSKRSITDSKTTSEKKESTNERPILGFKGIKNMDGIPNRVFPLIVTSKIANNNVSRILIYGGSSRDIMYVKLLERLGLDSERLLWTYVLVGMTIT